MSYTEEQLWELLHQSHAMPYGPGQVALVEQVIEHADAQRLTDLAFAARMQATTSYTYSGEPARAVVTFAWCLAEFDRNPVAYERHHYLLLWHFKYMVGALTRVPEVPLQRTYEVLDDMERRWRETGHSLHAVHANRHIVARHVGDVEAAQHWYVQWCAAPRDDLSDCVGCDPTSKVRWLASQGQDEQAAALADPVLAGRLTCNEQPQSILTALMVPYLRTGRLDQARDAHRRAYRLHRPNLADLADIAEHVEFCARTGNEARAVEIVERHLGWLDRAPSPWAEMVFAASAALALRRADDLHAGELTLYRPGHGDREAARVPAADLVEEFTTRATGLAARFDTRNGTDHIGTLMRGILEAQPWLEYLPLSPTAPRPAPIRSTVEDHTVARPPTTEPHADRPHADQPREPVTVPETAGPDELLDHIEDWYEQDRDDAAEAALDAFTERYGDGELTVGQGARLADSRGIRQADTGDLEGAIAQWRAAAQAYAEASNIDGEQRALARLGAALCRSGRADEGLPLAVAATERLLTSTDPRIRVGAAVRLAGCHAEVEDHEAALTVLDRPEADPAGAPARLAATHAAMRVQTLFNLSRTREVQQAGPEAIALAEAAGMAEVVARLHSVLAVCLEMDGNLTEAAAHLDQAIPGLTDAEERSLLRLARAHQLARTERAAEVVDDLVEAVADLTARGRAPEAASARQSLAIAYLNAGRLLDAAEVAEEALSFWLRDAAARPADQPALGEPAQALQARHLLAAIYQRLGEPNEAIGHLDAIAGECARVDNHAGVGQVSEEAGEVLERADRDGEAADRFLAAAEAYARAGSPFDEVRNRRRHALSVTLAQGPEPGLAALAAAAQVVAGMPADDPAVRWEQARLDYDEARIRWRTGELGRSAELAGRAADTWLAIDEVGAASEARLMRARLLLNDGRADDAQAAARQALAELPDPERRGPYVETLDAALRAAGRAADADAVWAEYGVTRPENGS